MFYILFANQRHSVAIFFLEKSVNFKIIILFLVTFPSEVNNNHEILVSLNSTFSVTNLQQRTHLPLPTHMQMYLAIITTAT